MDQKSDAFVSGKSYGFEEEGFGYVEIIAENLGDGLLIRGRDVHSLELSVEVRYLS